MERLRGKQPRRVFETIGQARAVGADGQVVRRDAHPAEGKFGADSSAGQQQDSTEEKARPILPEELQSVGCKRGELEKRLKADPDEVRIARRLRGETTVTIH